MTQMETEKAEKRETDSPRIARMTRMERVAAAIGVDRRLACRLGLVNVQRPCSGHQGQWDYKSTRSVCLTMIPNGGRFLSKKRNTWVEPWGMRLPGLNTWEARRYLG
jgi:hypothetical protein